MQPEFREALLGLVGNAEERDRIAKTPEDRDRNFVMALAEQYRRETAPLMVEVSKSPAEADTVAGRQLTAILGRFAGLGGGPTDEAKAGENSRAASGALSDEANAVAYAEFGLLADAFNAMLQFSVGWLQTATTKWPDNHKLKYILATFLSFVPSEFLPSGFSVQKALRDSLNGPDDLTDLYVKYLVLRERSQSEQPAFRELANRILREFVQYEPGVSVLAMFESLYEAFLAEQYLIQDYLYDAEMMVNKALSHWSGSPYALALRGQIWLSRQHRRYEIQAERDFRIAIAGGKELKGLLRFVGLKAQVYAHLGLSYYYFGQGEYGRAASHCDTALELNHDPYTAAVILLNRARSYLEAGPKHFGKVHSNLNDVEVRLANLERDGLPENDFRSRVLLNRGLTWHRQGMDGRAKSEYEKAIRLNADLAEAYNNLGRIYADENQTRRAGKLFRIAIEKDSGLVKARANLDQLDENSRRDWWMWWFGAGAPRPKMAFGALLVLALLFQLGLCFRQLLVHNGVIGTANLIVAGIIGLILVLPLVETIKLGGVELDLKSESKGQNPVE